MKCQSSREFVLKNADVQLTIYSPIYLVYMTHSLRGCTAPNHLVIYPQGGQSHHLWTHPGIVHIKALPFDPILFIVVSSDQITLLWSSLVWQSLDLAYGPARWWDCQP